MPQINVIVMASATREKMALEERRNKTNIRLTLTYVTGYDFEDIAIVPRILSQEEEGLSDNMYPLCFVVDLGIRPALGIDDSIADQFRDELCNRCPAFRSLHFGVWLKRHPSNGHSEHKPEIPILQPQS